MRELSDVEVVRAWADGSTEAGDEIAGRYFDEIRAFLLNSVPDEDCADVLQTVFLGLTDAVERFKNYSSFRTYLYGIARNVVAEYYRKRYAAQGLFDPDTQSVAAIDAVRPSSAVDRVRSARRLNTCLRQLPVNDRLMIEMFYWRDFSTVEISEIFDMSQEAIRTRLFRARQKLGKMYAECREESVDRGDLAALEAQLHTLGLEIGRIGPAHEPR